MARRLSISKRFVSPRGVVRNCKRTFVTSRRSTLLSVWFRRRRRRASMRCSFIIMALWKSTFSKRKTSKTRMAHFHVVVSRSINPFPLPLSRVLPYDLCLQSFLLIASRRWIDSNHERCLLFFHERDYVPQLCGHDVCIQLVTELLG